jgi:protocatechuate 3,4-dioxygenase beta subunit
VVARRDLVLTLGRTTPGVALAGKVVDGAGSPVEAAQVSFGLDVTETDEEGRFAFQSDDPKALNKMAREFGLPVPENLLRALRPGYLPAELRAPLGADGRPAWPAPLVLVLGSTPLTIAGRVLDAHGSPQGGIRVWVADPTFFGGLRQEPAERGPEFAEVEGLLDGRRPGWSWAESDAEGRFTLGGLLPRDYVLAALDPSTLQRVELAHVAAGAREVELVFPGGALLPKLAGRVVDGRGEPVPNLSVFPMCDAKEIRLEGQVIATHHEVTRGTSTNAEGWFELERVPKHAVYLRLQGADTLPLEWGRGLAGGLETLCGEKREELVITVERRCHFQVELALAGEADELGLLDADGETLVISEFFGNGRNDTERHPIVDGRSRMLAASDKAATLVLYRAGLEVRRVAVRLAPGTPQSVKL